MKSLIKVGIAGYGIVGKKRSDCIKKNPSMRLVAVCDKELNVGESNGIKCFKDYKKWRLNFKFPKTTFLSRVQNVKPIPDINLINNLAKSISELREEFLSLKNYFYNQNQIYK